jgi:hypothetical protein
MNDNQSNTRGYYPTCLNPIKNTRVQGAPPRAPTMYSPLPVPNTDVLPTKGERRWQSR